MKSDLYKVPPPKIRNIPIYKLARKRKRERERCGNKVRKNTTAKAARENSSRRVERTIEMCETENEWECDRTEEKEREKAKNTQESCNTNL